MATGRAGAPRRPGAEPAQPACRQGRQGLSPRPAAPRPHGSEGRARDPATPSAAHPAQPPLPASRPASPPQSAPSAAGNSAGGRFPCPLRRTRAALRGPLRCRAASCPGAAAGAPAAAPAPGRRAERAKYLLAADAGFAQRRRRRDGWSRALGGAALRGPARRGCLPAGCVRGPAAHRGRLQVCTGRRGRAARSGQGQGSGPAPPAASCPAERGAGQVPGGRPAWQRGAVRRRPPPQSQQSSSGSCGSGRGRAARIAGRQAAGSASPRAGGRLRPAWQRTPATGAHGATSAGPAGAGWGLLRRQEHRGESGFLS